MNLMRAGKIVLMKVEVAIGSGDSISGGTVVWSEGGREREGRRVVGREREKRTPASLSLLPLLLFLLPFDTVSSSLIFLFLSASFISFSSSASILVLPFSHSAVSHLPLSNSLFISFPFTFFSYSLLSSSPSPLCSLSHLPPQHPSFSLSPLPLQHLSFSPSFIFFFPPPSSFLPSLPFSLPLILAYYHLHQYCFF